MNKSEPNDCKKLTMQSSNLKHGGNVYAKAKKLNLLPSEIIDASASLVPFDPPQILICLLYTSPSPRDNRVSRMPSSA